MQWLALSPHSKKVLGSILGQDVSVWNLHVLPVSVWVLSGYSDFLSQSEYMQAGVRQICHSKLPKGVNVSLDGCLSLYVSSVMNW